MSLNLVDGNGKLVYAGSLLFVSTPLDYIRRTVRGAESVYREHMASRPLLEQIYREQRKSCCSRQCN